MANSSPVHEGGSRTRHLTTHNSYDRITELELVNRIAAQGV